MKKSYALISIIAILALIGGIYAVNFNVIDFSTGEAAFINSANDTANIVTDNVEKVFKSVNSNFTDDDLGKTFIDESGQEYTYIGLTNIANNKLNSSQYPFKEVGDVTFEDVGKTFVRDSGKYEVISYVAHEDGGRTITFKDLSETVVEPAPEVPEYEVPYHTNAPQPVPCVPIDNAQNASAE